MSVADNFELLRNIVRPVSSVQLKVNLTKVSEIIDKNLVGIVKDSAPPDFHVLYGDFKAEYEKFKDFILYERLIGKNIVALGGGFSSGKSSFLNAVMGKPVLPADIDPSTSVPTFIVKGDTHYLSGINAFDATFEIPNVKMIQKISHGFGKGEDEETENPADVVTLGHIVESLFFSTHLHKYEHLAFLDTPGYSKADTASYSSKTDEQIARRQLNTANCILWFVQADAGTITEDDVKFIKTLNETTPKLIILNKADKKTDEDLKRIAESIKATLELKGVKYVDVLAFSTKNPGAYDSDKIYAQLENWNLPNEKNNFAVNFKKLFVQCFDYYENEIEQEAKQLKGLNKALTLVDEPTVCDSLNYIVKITKANLSKLEEVRNNLKNLQTDFFTEIKVIGDIIGIQMPEPSEIDLISDKLANPYDVLKDYLKEKGLKPNPRLQDMMSEALDGVASELNSPADLRELSGGMDYSKLKEIANRAPIEDHPLELQDDERLQEHYITLLLTAIYASEGSTEGAWLLVQRIMIGADLSAEISELAVKALKISGEQIGDIVTEIIDADLAQIFALDIMVLYLCCKANKQNLLSFIIGIFELFSISEKEIKPLKDIAVLLAKAEIVFGNIEKMDEEGLYAYIPIDGSSICWFRIGMPWKLHILSYLGTRKMFIVDTELQLVRGSRYVDSILLADDVVKFINCEFTKIDAEQICIGGKNEMVFDNCLFKGISNNELKIAVLEGTAFANKKCKFINCKSSCLSVSETQSISFMGNGCLNIIDCKAGGLGTFLNQFK